jgi:hypothetical protein
MHVEISDLLRFGISVLILLVAVAYSHVPVLRVVLRPVLVWLSQGLAIINALVAWALLPFKGLVMMIGRIFRRPENAAL